MAGTLRIRVVNGRREDFDPDTRLLITARNASGRYVIRERLKRPSDQQHIVFDGLPVHGNGDDIYTVLVSAKDHIEGGKTGVVVKDGAPTTVPVILVPRNADFAFEDASGVRSGHPELHRLLRDSCPNRTEAEFDAFYGQLATRKRPELACLMNVVTALSTHLLPDPIEPKNPPVPILSMITRINTMHARHPGGLLQDRFFAFADSGLFTRLSAQKDSADATFGAAGGGLHPGATASFKERRVDEAGVQITFIGKPESVGGREQVEIDADIDYFKGVGHGLLEVLPNLLGGVTDPRVVYGLRWIAKEANFIPPYRLMPRA